VFTVMPFSDAVSKIWNAGILAACQKLGFDCVRADLINRPGFVVNQVYDAIAAADVIIGDMSGSNPNVFYEIGFAHALGKETILLATSPDDLKPFDTSGRRHFLHRGDPERTRGYLIDALRGIEQLLAVEPKVPHGAVLFEWPSATLPPPKLRWQSRAEERHLQLDGDGGQRFVETDGLGQALLISNTAEMWNHSSGRSIMTLLFTRDLSVGDILHLFVEARATGRAELSWAGDGGWVEGVGVRKWAQVWPDNLLTIGQSAVWKCWAFSTSVAPTCEGYDLKRGTAVYLLTKTGQHTVLFKKIRLVRRPAS